MKHTDPASTSGIYCESVCEDHGGRSCRVGTSGGARHTITVHNLTTFTLFVSCESDIKNTTHIEFLASSKNRWVGNGKLAASRRASKPEKISLGGVGVRSFYGVTAHEDLDSTVEVERKTQAGNVTVASFKLKLSLGV
jgi:hypothetical protein